MKLLRSAVIVLVIGVTSISTASARDSFSLGVNIGGYGYAPPVAYYPAPPVVYYSKPVYYRAEPPVYYRAEPPVYYQPVVSYQYYNVGHRGYDRGWCHHGRGRGDWGYSDYGNHGGHDEGHHGRRD